MNLTNQVCLLFTHQVAPSRSPEFVTEERAMDEYRKLVS